MQRPKIAAELIKTPIGDNRIRTPAKAEETTKHYLDRSQIRISTEISRIETVIEISKIEIRNLIIRQVVTNNRMIKIMMITLCKSNGPMVMTDSNNRVREVLPTRAMKDIISVAIRITNDR
jgi:hypothetical protein